MMFKEKERNIETEIENERVRRISFKTVKAYLDSNPYPYLDSPNWSG
jgi:hypothetical protein